MTYQMFWSRGLWSACPQEWGNFFSSALFRLLCSIESCLWFSQKYWWWWKKAAKIVRISFFRPSSIVTIWVYIIRCCYHTLKPTWKRGEIVFKTFNLTLSPKGWKCSTGVVSCCKYLVNKSSTYSQNCAAVSYHYPIILKDTRMTWQSLMTIDHQMLTAFMPLLWP